MLKKFLKPKKILITILVVTAFLRLWRLDYPNKYVFDEVYHAYTAKEYLKGNKDAWSPWGKSAPGVAFEWLHPPIAKELMTASMYVLQDTDAWAWRIPGTFLGILSVYLVYKLALLLFKRNQTTALISAFLFSIDGLVFVQSRTGMNDAYLVTFVLISMVFFAQRRFFLSALFAGIAVATKWSGIFLPGVYFPILLYQRQFKYLLYFLVMMPLIYLLSYTPYFLIGYSWSDFIELHRQIWWYQTHLKATHDYASPWWSWPLNLYPVWYFVDYQKGLMANIFASGNPVLFWLGSAAMLINIWQFIQKFIIFKSLSVIKKFENLFIIIAGFLVFWLPWAISPRIMFLYHFSPSVPFLSIGLGYQLGKSFEDKKTRKIVYLILGLCAASFIFIYPFLVGIPLPNKLVQLFFLTNITKDPFH